MPLLEVADLTYRYPDGTHALSGVSFAVERGEKVALLGPMGAGKSTLLLHLNGLLLPASGGVTIDGIGVSGGTLREVRKRVGLVFQDPDDQLFLPSLLEDVAFGPLNEGRNPADAELLARGVLQSLGLGGNELRAAHHLSGGEKRLAALATVLVSHPLVLVLDEPTSNLDARGKRRLVGLLRQREETLLVATHDLTMARALCERAVVMAGGALVHDGRLEHIVANQEFLDHHGLWADL